MTSDSDRAPQFARPPLTWNSAGRDYAAMTVPARWPAAVSPDAAWGNATGAGVRVCIVDSGVEDGHPRVGQVQASYAVEEDDDGNCAVAKVPAEDMSGHGTACASIVRSLAPDCEIHSVRVLGAGYTGSAAVLLGGLEWAINEGFHIVNMSLSTTRAIRSRAPTSWVTSPVTAPRARASSVRSRRTARSTASACSAPATRGQGPSSSAACAGPWSRASTS